MLLLSMIKDRIFYGWVVVVAFIIVGTALWGVRLSFGVFFKPIASEFDLTRAATSTVFSVYMLLGSLFSILGGWASDRYGPRIVILFMGLFTGLGLLLTSQTSALWQLFITYSLLLSIGTCAIYTVVMSTVSRWFTKTRGLALGIASVGGGLGPACIAPFATYLIYNLDWHMAYLVIGVIVLLVVIPLSRLLKKEPYEIGTLPNGVKSDSTNRLIQKPRNEVNHTKPIDFSLLQAARGKSFWLLMVVMLFSAFAYFLILTQIIPHVTDIGFSAAEAASVLSVIGVMSIAGRVLMGAVSDRIGSKGAVIICALLKAGAMIWLIWSQDLWMFYLFALVFGLTWGGSSPSMAALNGETFGLSKIGAIIGIQQVGFGIGAAIGSAIGGLIFDVSSSYFIAFLLGAVAMLIVTLLTALVRPETQYSDRNS